MHGNYEQSYTDKNNNDPGWRFTNGSGSGTFTDEDGGAFKTGSSTVEVHDVISSLSIYP